jgi:hypothetical protein
MSFAPAYPSADTGVRNHLLGAPSTSGTQCKAYLRSFLSSFFTSARHQAETLFLLNDKVSYICMAKTFYDFFKDASKRDNFYRGVIIGALRNDASTNVWQSFKMLEAYLMRRCSNWPSTECPILVSMDEVHILSNSRPQDADPAHTLYSHLTLVLNEVVSGNFCVLLLSTATTGSISKLAPSREVHPSAIAIDCDRLLPTPFTELPFDTYIISDPLISGKSTLASVGSLEFTSKFGRPL